LRSHHLGWDRKQKKGLSIDDADPQIDDFDFGIDGRCWRTTKNVENRQKILEINDIDFGIDEKYWRSTISTLESTKNLQDRSKILGIDDLHIQNLPGWQTLTGLALLGPET
jgi:hypothetical protein